MSTVLVNPFPKSWENEQKGGLGRLFLSLPGVNCRQHYFLIGGSILHIHSFSALIIATLTVGLNSTAIASPFPVGGEVSITSINLSEPVTIKANFDDWETDELKPGNRLYSKQVARAGVRINRFQIGYSKHLYYYLNFSNDTARLHFLERNDRLDQDKNTFNIHLDANNAEAEGLFLGYDFSWKGLTVGATLTYLKLQDLYYGEASGFFDPAETLDNGTYLRIDYAYPEDRIFEREVEPPEGNGLTLDLRAQYQWQAHSASLAINEAYSDLYWNTAPGSLIEGNINSLRTNNEAAIRFTNFRTRFHQRLPIHTEAQYRYRLNPQFGAGVNYEKMDNKKWWKWVGDWHITNSWTGSILWAPTDDIFGVQIKHPNFLIGLESDSSDYRESHYLKLQMLARVLF